MHNNKDFFWRFSKLESNYINSILRYGFNYRKKNFKNLLEETWSKKFNIKYSISFNSCTSALHSSFLALDLKKNSEVLVPALTPIMCATTIYMSGLVPIYVDIDPETFLIDYNDLEKKITNKTKAVLAVHMYSGICNLKKLKSICKTNNLFLVEDCAEAFGAKDENQILVGTAGDISCWSFQSAKHITCGDGGMASTNNSFLAKRLRKIGNLGFSTLKASNKQSAIPKNVRQNPNFNRFDELGYNYRLNEFSSAISLAQLKNAKRLITLRRKAGHAYEKIMAKFSNFVQKQKIQKFAYPTYYTLAFFLKNSKISWQKFRNVFIKNGGEPFYAASKLCNQEKTILKYSIGKCFKYCKPSCVKRCKGTPVAKKIQKKLILLTTNQSNINQILKQAYSLNKTLNFFFKDKFFFNNK